MDIIEEFYRIRDIPYRIPLSPEEPDDCCSGKALRLFDIFEAHSHDVRHRVCYFKWSDLNIPEEVLAVPHGDECTHSYLEVKIDGEWVIVDPTWDKGVAHILPVNEWDGHSNTKVAVPTYNCLSPEESARYMEEMSTPERVAEDLEQNGAFYKAFNEWLEGERNK